MGREFELKYRASARQLDTIFEDFDGFREIAMETTYYDTPEGTLSQRKWTLRQRLENGLSVCTLKTPAENGGREEFEVSCEDIQAAIPELCKLGAPAELEELTRAGVQKVCGARFVRQAAAIMLEDCTLELALDRGILQGGFRIQLLREVEVELKEGSEEAATAFARTLAEKYGLIPERHSKYRRALALTGMI